MAKTRKVKIEKETEDHKNNRLKQIEKDKELKKIQFEKKIEDLKNLEEGKIFPIVNDKDKKKLKNFGFKFDEEICNNFQKIIIPDKWEIKKDKNNFLYFLDDKKRKRVSIIFLKEKNNKKYNIIILRRFNLSVITNKEKKYVYGVVYDFNKIIHETKKIEYEQEVFSGNYFKEFDKAYFLAKKYLYEEKKDWENK